MKVSLVVGKVDAGVAVLLTEDKRLIEFPSILLPSDISSGSVVDVNVSRNTAAEATARKSFNALQAEILKEFGSETPSPPALRCRNATQTSIVLEWDPIHTAAADLRSLALYRDGAKAGNIPRPFETHSTKISGLAVDKEYSFSLVLRTSAGVYSSEKLFVKTHKMTDLSGITVTPGAMDAGAREAVLEAVGRIGAKVVDAVRIDTTHFVCTEGRGAEWDKAKEMNIPIVLPEWLLGCEKQGRLVGVRGYYLNADPRMRQAEAPPQTPGTPGPSQAGVASPRPGVERDESARSVGRVDTPRTEVTPPTPERAGHDRPREEEEDDEDDDEEREGDADKEKEGAQAEQPEHALAKSLAMRERGGGRHAGDNDDDQSSDETVSATGSEAGPFSAQRAAEAASLGEQPEAGVQEPEGSTEQFDEVKL